MHGSMRFAKNKNKIEKEWKKNRKRIDQVIEEAPQPELLLRRLIYVLQKGEKSGIRVSGKKYRERICMDDYQIRYQE